MSNDKKYSPVEVAAMVAERLRECLKKHEVGVENLHKSSNSAHEIDAGEEPNSDGSECPASLSSNGSGSSETMESSEYSEDSEMEDQALDGEYEEEEDEEDKTKTKDKTKDSDDEYEDESEDEEEESDEDDYEFKKSEACGHNIVYKRLSKDEAEGNKVNSSFDREKKDVEWTKDQNDMINSTKPGKKKSSRADQAKHVEEAKKRRAKFKAEDAAKVDKSEGKKKDLKKCKDDEDCGCDESPKGELEKNNDNQVEKTKGITHDKENKADKDKENFKRPMEKCGDMIEAKKSEKLDNFLKKKEKMLELKKAGTSGSWSKEAPKPSTPSIASNRSSTARANMAQNFGAASASKPSTGGASDSWGDGASKPSIASNRSSTARANMAQNFGGDKSQTKAKALKSPAADSKAGKSNGEYVLQNAPKGSGREAQEKFNAGVDKGLGIDKKKAPAAKKRSAFGQAFDTARKAGKTQFEFTKKDGTKGMFHTRHKGEKSNPHAQKQEQRQAPARQEQKQAPARQEQAPARRKEMGPDISRQALKRDQRAGRISGGDEQRQAPARQEQKQAPARRKPDLSMKAFDAHRRSPEGYANKRKARQLRSRNFRKSESKLAKFVEKQNDLKETE